MRTTLGQICQSQLPQAIGLSNQDVPNVAAAVNRATQILVNAGGETGWWGGWQKVVFSVSQAHPYLTLPAQYARIINLAVCRQPIRLENEFYEVLLDSIGPQDFSALRNQGVPCDWCGELAGYERGTYLTTVDLTPANQYLQVVITDPRDAGARILFGPAKDQYGNGIYSQDGSNQVNGFYLSFAVPPYSATSPMIVSDFGGVQKDPTYGDVLLYQVDATTGVPVLLARYGPREVTPAYRRYYFHRLPRGCVANCPPANPCAVPAPDPPPTLLTALCKLEWQPVFLVTDFCVIANIPALIEECKSLRYADMDNTEAAQLEAKCHGRAIRLLQQELAHYTGKLELAVNFKPFGNASLAREGIGYLR